MSRKRRRPDPADPFPLISWDGVPEEESVGTAVLEEAAPPPVASPSRQERKQKRKKERANVAVPLPATLPKVRTGFDSRFWFRAAFALGGAAIAATLVAALWLWKRPEQAPAQAEVAFAAPAISTAIEDLEKSLTKDAEPSAAGLAFGYKPGDVLTYNFEFVQNLTVGLSAAFMETAQRRGGSVSASQVRDVRLGWRLGGRADLAVYEAEEKLVVGWRFSSMSLDLRGDAADAVAAAPGERAGTLDTLRAELNREALVTMTRRGGIEGVAFAKGTTPWVQALLSAVVLTARVTLPEAPVAAWRATETDATGKYVADYASEGGFSTADGKTARIARTKAAYEHLTCQSPAGTGSLSADDAKTSLEGGAVALWDSGNGRFRTFRVDEKLRLEGKEFAQTVTSTTAGGMRFASAARDENLAANGAAMAKAFRENGEGLKPGSGDIAAKLASQAETARLRGLTGGMSIDDAIARLEKLAGADQLDSPEAAELVDRLAAILKLDDAAVSVALEVILQGTAHPAVRVALTDALGAAETPRSLLALLEIAGNEALDPDIRGNAFTGLAMAEAPPAGAEAAARAAATFGDPSADPALLALGMLARKADASRADELADTLKSLGRASSDPDWQSTYLESLGNAGLPGTLGEIEKFLARDDVHTRARAAFALRFVKGERADTLLASARRDAAPAVRLGAVSALGFRQGEEAQSLLEDSLRDSDPQVRAAAERALASK
ncbi:MAG: peptidase C14 caspase catalytic subunit [Planctomycetota bacterium]|nr:MAG: peptidase C14 caspase catalytic subunit [Planctomycetota bacterium]